MLTQLFPALRRAALFGIPVIALAFVYMLSAQSPVAASAEFRLFFAELDADADDRITDAETVAFLRQDGWRPEPGCADGTAEADEPCTIEAAATDHLGLADSDGDGVVVYTELAALLLRDRAEEFLDADFDGNGMVTLDELAGYELYWYAQEPAIAAEDGIVLSQGCRDQLAAEEVAGIAAVCGFTEEARYYLAEIDADRDGRVSLIEYLEY